VYRGKTLGGFTIRPLTPVMTTLIRVNRPSLIRAPIQSSSFELFSESPTTEASLAHQLRFYFFNQPLTGSSLLQLFQDSR
jgi:hypothetical protein